MKKLIDSSDKFFIAGANGMVGTAIYKILKENNYGDKKNNGKILTPKREELDLLDYVAVQKWFAKNKPTVVIIAAAKVGGIIANSKSPSDFLLDNLKIQSNLIEAAKNFKVKRLLFLGSSCIYPKYCKQPIKEEYLLSGELEPTNQWYAIAKIAGLKLCEALRIQYRIDTLSLMPTNLYGPGDNYNLTNSHVFAALIRRLYEAKKESLKEVICWGSGKPLREFMHVNDLAAAVLFCLEKWNPNTESVTSFANGKKLNYLNVGTGEEVSIKRLAELIAAEVGYEGKIKWDISKPDGTPRKVLNIDRIKQLGWEHSISLKEGLKSTVKEFIYNYKKRTLKI